MTADSSPDGRLDRALASLRGLAVGDALGSQFFVPANYPLLKRRELPPGPWQWTDDTEMACSVVAVLAAHRPYRPGRAGPLLRRAPRLRPRLRPRGQPAAAADPGGRRLARAGRPPSSTDRARGATARRCGSPRWAPGTRTIRSRPRTRPRSPPTPRTSTARPWSAPWPSPRRPRWPPTPAGPPSAEALLDGVIALVPRSAVGAGLRRARDMLDYGDTDHGRRRPRLRAAYDGARHRAVRPLVGGPGPRRLRGGLLGDRPGGRRHGHDLRHRGRRRRLREGRDAARRRGWSGRRRCRTGCRGRREQDDRSDVWATARAGRRGCRRGRRVQDPGGRLRGPERLHSLSLPCPEPVPACRVSLWSASASAAPGRLAVPSAARRAAATSAAAAAASVTGLLQRHCHGLERVACGYPFRHAAC